MKLYNFLKKLVDSNNFYNEVDNEINEIVNLLRHGYSKTNIKKIYKTDIDFLFEFARSRIKISGKFSNSSHLFMDYYSAMYSTPEIIGKYRSNKLSGNNIIDAGSGAGMQDIMFSINSKVTGIEIDKNRYMMACLNKMSYNSDANFINSDFYSFNGDFSGSILFSDPLRPVNSKEKTFSQLSPDPLGIIRHTPEISGYAIDLPPHMEWENIPLAGEKEYISYKGELNRLTVYSPSISKNNSTAVILPENIIITGEPKDLKYKAINGFRIGSYIYVPDISLYYAKLLYMAIKPEWVPIYIDGRRQIFTGNSKEKLFPGKQYAVLDCSSSLDIVPMLNDMDAGKIFFRFSMEPSEMYHYKNLMEKELSGIKNIYIFKSGNKFIITEEVN
jgi:hypothetical protein